MINKINNFFAFVFKWFRNRKESPSETLTESYPSKKGELKSSLPAKRGRAKSDLPPFQNRRNRKIDPVDSLKPDFTLEQFLVPEEEGKVRFHDLGLPLALMHAIYDVGFKYCTPIQAAILAQTLSGRDAFGRAQTGTGKTAAFLVTIISRLVRENLKRNGKRGAPRALVLAPTRELVLQIASEAKALIKYVPLNVATVFGGMDYIKQKRVLAQDVVDIIIATPGRLLDYHKHNDIDLKSVKILIIDEADRMLDMGFIPEVRKIIYSTPHKRVRQTMLFSATLTESITRLAAQWTKDPLSVEIEPEQVAVDTVEQIVYVIETKEKFPVLYNIIMKQKLKRILIFCNRKDETRRLTRLLLQYQVNCAILSGDIPQKKRIQTLDKFKSGKIRALVATDVAGRGIHIEGMSHVINYTLPHDPEDYVHRIGRTGRAGTSGTSISFACEDDAFYIPKIEGYLKSELKCIQPPPEWLELPPAPPPPVNSNTKSKGGDKERESGYAGKPNRKISHSSGRRYRARKLS